METLLRIRAFRNAYLLRGTLVWLAIRMVSAFGGVLDPNLVQEGYVLVAVGVAVLLDARRRGEDLFLANLGVPAVTVAAAGVLAPLLLELVVP